MDLKFAQPRALVIATVKNGKSSDFYLNMKLWPFRVVKVDVCDVNDFFFANPYCDKKQRK